MNKNDLLMLYYFTRQNKLIFQEVIRAEESLNSIAAYDRVDEILNIMKNELKEPEQEC